MYGIMCLPNPALIEILCRVPIKTLTASKSVCKSWLNLIKDTKFCQMHQRRSPTEVCFQAYHDSKSNSLELHLGNFDFPNNLDPCHFQIPNFSVGPNNVPKYNAGMGRLTFANSCNVLLCYYSYTPNSSAVVWNPCTSEFITFPPPSTRQYCRGYGLGFSRKENKFKLLRLMRVSSKPSHELIYVGDVCTIEKSCSWKRVGPCSPHAWFSDYSNTVWDLTSVFFQGTLHWVGTDSHRACIAIHTFDFEDDRFGTLPLPPCFSETDKNMLRGDRLGLLKDCLFVTEYTNGGATIWLMREYGVQDSWRKLFSLGSTVDKGLQMRYSQCLPITYMDNGEILMKCTYPGSTIILYNPVQSSAGVIGSGPVSLIVIAYRPSLVPLRDSMMGYDVHVKPKCPGLKQGEISRTPCWWEPVILVEPRQKDSSNAVPLIDAVLSNARVGEEMEGLVNAASESSASDESPARTAGQSQGHVRDIRGKGEEISSHKQDELGQSQGRIRGIRGKGKETSSHKQDELGQRQGHIRDTRGKGKETSPRKQDELGHSQEHIRDIRGKGKETSSHKQDELVQNVTLVEANKSQLALLLEIEKLKYRDKELEHRSKELEQRDKILEQREKLLNILQELDNTDQSPMTAGELDRHLNKIKRYENLVTRTFDQ